MYEITTNYFNCFWLLNFGKLMVRFYNIVDQLLNKGRKLKTVKRSRVPDQQQTIFESRVTIKINTIVNFSNPKMLCLLRDIPTKIINPSNYKYFRKFNCFVWKSNRGPNNDLQYPSFITYTTLLFSNILLELESFFFIYKLLVFWNVDGNCLLNVVIPRRKEHKAVSFDLL